MTDRELFIKALDALEYEANETRPEDLYGCNCLICKTIEALRDRLAQTEPGPVTHTLNCVCGAVWDIKNDKSEEMVHTPDTTSPQRKPLTDEVISNIWCKVSNTDFVTADTHEFARAIEAAHGIKP